MELHSKQQFQLGLIKFFAVMIVLVVAPFAVWRYLNGEYFKAALDAAIILVVVSHIAFALWHKKTTLPLILAAVFYSCATVAVIYVNGHAYAIWLHPLIIANFLLLTTRTATLLSALAIAATLPVILGVDHAITSLSMLASMLFSGSMACIFARLTDQQRELLSAAASEDALTQLGNRRQMDQEVDYCIDDFQRGAGPTTMILLDLDRFKQANDQYGHAMGDQLLITLAQLLKQRARKTDRVFRYGGEEFVILARNTPLPEAAIMAEDLRQRVEYRLMIPSGAVTASFGCAQLREGENAEQWFERADQAMLAAKRQGRNQVVVAD